MKFSEDTAANRQLINSYDSTSIHINEQRYSHSLLLSHMTLAPDWPVSDIQQLNNETLRPVLELEPEVIIIGTGEQICFPSPEQYSSVIQKGIGIEFMTTGAACRTYNLLVSENRKVILGIIFP